MNAVETSICANCGKAICKVEGFGWRHDETLRNECNPLMVAMPKR